VRGAARIIRSAHAVRAFASDNYAPALPEALEAIAAVNSGHAISYDADPVTERLTERVREHFGPEATGFPVFNGTGANVVGLRAMLRPWQGVICAESAHLNVDEGGAPEVVGGIKLLTVPTPDGKLTTELVERRMTRIGDEHVIQPGVVAIAQATELGTLYTVEEMAALAEHAHAHGMRFHVDGSRLANAAAALNVGLADITAGVGADVVSFGGTKVGLLAGEIVVVLDPSLLDALPYLRKQTMQLASKMRFVSAQLEALLTGDLWRRAAGHANAMARRLADAVADHVTITQPVQANSVFAILPPESTATLQQDFRFYIWDEHTGEVRWMCAWDTAQSDVDAFAAAIASVTAGN
jgi:threonine aldolase